MPHGSKAATSQDWDSEEESVVPGTEVQARRQQLRSASRTPKPIARSNGKDATSDSGYSSHTSANMVKKSPAPIVDPAPQKPVQPPVAASPTKSKPKPIIRRTDSARSTQRSQPTLNPPQIPSAQCVDPNCRDPNCSTSSYRERPYPVPQQPQRQPYVSYQQHPQPYEYEYAPTPTMSQPTAMLPPSIPRARSGSISLPRPNSMYASMPYNGFQSGPPPSSSAYYALNQPYPPQSPTYLGSTPPTHTLDYTPTSPVPPSPTISFSAYSGFQGTEKQISARQMTIPSSGGLTRTMSARRAERPMPEPESTESESGSASDSDSSGAERQYAPCLRRRSRNEARPEERTMAVVPRSHRSSSNKKYYSEPRQQSTSRPAPLRRLARAEHDYPSSSDIGDSDRTACAVVDRRGAVSSARSSRRPSIATTSSSGRTKATSLSSNTDYSRVILEGPNGRRTAYLSKDEQDVLIRRYQQQRLEDKYEQQRLREERVAVYQEEVGGNSYDLTDLTAENIRKSQNRKSGSHLSGRSHRSTGSGSKDGIKIQSGDTVLHVYGDAKIEMKASEDGGPAQFVIASANGRDSAYQTTSSKSSGSRVSRGRGRNERDRDGRRPVRRILENEYEEAL